MHRNPVWLGFLALICLATLWIGGKTTYQVYQTLSMSETTKPQSLMLSIKKKSSNSFYPRAQYAYLVAGKEYQGRSDLVDLRYLREEFLEKDLSKIQTERSWTIYYNPANPASSSLEHKIPYKNIAYSAIMVGLLGYFLWLGFIPKQAHSSM